MALTIIRLIAVVFTGLLAGIFLGDRAGGKKGRVALSPSSFVLYQQAVHRVFVRMMPPLSFGAVLAGLAWLYIGRSQWVGWEFWLVAGATGGMLLALALTISINVPLNNRLMMWNASAPPSDMKQQWAPWERVHTIRTVISVVAFVAEAVALNARALG
jgi:uncharacterized membrane protein